jgi:hypothetical protein
MTPKLLAALVAAAVLPVAAQTAAPRIDQRQATQETRIQKQDKAKADAAVTPRERARLAKSQNKNRKLAKQKQDAQKRPPAG